MIKLEGIHRIFHVGDQDVHDVTLQTRTIDKHLRPRALQRLRDVWLESEW